MLHPNGRKCLFFDSYQCGNCANFTMVFWSPSSSSGRDLHDYRQIPLPLGKIKGPEHWPQVVSRFWVQAQDNLKHENWDAARVMARSSLQAALRQQNASGPNLAAEINSLAEKGIIPPIMKEWAHSLRLDGNESAHPKDDEGPAQPEDVRDLVKFLDFFFEYLYDLPERIAQFKARRETSSQSEEAQ